MKIELDQVKTIGGGIIRPEGVMALDDGTIYTADARGGCARITTDGYVSLLGDLGGVPNGICIDTDGSIIVANIGNGKVQRLKSDGSHDVLAAKVDGRFMRAPNFPFIDSKGNLWVTNSTEHEDIDAVLRTPAPDGSVFVITPKGSRIVADGLYFANGVTLDAGENYLYVAESTARRIVRFRIDADNILGPMEIYGPDYLGDWAFPDGIAFDIAQNLWVAFPALNAVGCITPDGRLKMVLTDPDRKILRRPANICFGGKDRKTAFIGSLDGETIPYFRVPHAGMRLIHQKI